MADILKAMFETIFGSNLQNLFVVVGFIFFITAIIDGRFLKKGPHLLRLNGSARILSGTIGTTLLLISTIAYIIDITITIRDPLELSSKRTNSQKVLSFTNQAFAQDINLVDSFRMRQRAIRMLRLDESNEIYIYVDDVNALSPTRIVIFRKKADAIIKSVNDDIRYEDLKKAISSSNIIFDKKIKLGREAPFSFNDKNFILNTPEK